MIAHGLPSYVALEPLDMRLGFERLGGIVRERMAMEPCTRALFAFIGKRGHTMTVLTWNSTGAVLVHKKLDLGKFEMPKAARAGDQAGSAFAQHVPERPNSNEFAMATKKLFSAT